jgi:hypothetical protein
MVPLCSAGRTAIRGREPPQFYQPCTIARCEGSDKSARAATIFIDNGAPQALVGCHENSFSVDVGSCGLSLGFEGDAIAEAFEAAFEVGDGSGLADLVEIGFAEVAVGQVLGEHVIGGDEDLVSDGESGA